jgi:hypothetical protein
MSNTQTPEASPPPTPPMSPPRVSILPAPEIDFDTEVERSIDPGIDIRALIEQRTMRALEIEKQNEEAHLDEWIQDYEWAHAEINASDIDPGAPKTPEEPLTPLPSPSPEPETIDPNAYLPRMREVLRGRNPWFKPRPLSAIGAYMS